VTSFTHGRRGAPARPQYPQRTAQVNSFQRRGATRPPLSSSTPVTFPPTWLPLPTRAFLPPPHLLPRITHRPMGPTSTMPHRSWKRASALAVAAGAAPGFNPSTRSLPPRFGGRALLLALSFLSLANTHARIHSTPRLHPSRTPLEERARAPKPQAEETLTTRWF